MAKTLTFRVAKNKDGYYAIDEWSRVWLGPYPDQLSAGRAARDYIIARTEEEAEKSAQPDEFAR